MLVANTRPIRRSSYAGWLRLSVADVLEELGTAQSTPEDDSFHTSRKSLWTLTVTGLPTSTLHHVPLKFEYKSKQRMLLTNERSRST
jgi:hypothetical protein